MGLIVFTGIIWGMVVVTVFVKPISASAFKHYKNSMSTERLEKHIALSVRRNVDESIKEEYRFRLLVLLGLVSIGLFVGIYMYCTRTESIEITELKKEEFGQGAYDMYLNAYIGNDTAKLGIRVPERQPTDEQLIAFFDKTAEELFEIALDGQEITHVCNDIKLIDHIENGAEVHWSISDMEYMDSQGRIRGEVPDEGVEIMLTAEIEYAEYKREYTLDINLFEKQTELSDEQKITNYIYENITDEKDSLFLPVEYENEALKYMTLEDENYKYIFIFVLTAAVLWWIVSRDKLDQAYIKRNEELIRDYPGILSRMTLFLAAGQSVPEAWKRIGDEYERRINEGEDISAGYEEQLLSVKQLQNTGQLENALALFGKRCAERHYRQFSALLIQSVKKGSVGLLQKMAKETDDAFNMRKENARNIGEKAQAKLMIPTFILFVLVIAVVVYPAWSGL